jgi:hypothetical protein
VAREAPERREEGVRAAECLSRASRAAPRPLLAVSDQRSGGGGGGGGARATDGDATRLHSPTANNPGCHYHHACHRALGDRSVARCRWWIGRRSRPRSRARAAARLLGAARLFHGSSSDRSCLLLRRGIPTEFGARRGIDRSPTARVMGNWDRIKCVHP